MERSLLFMMNKGRENIYCDLRGKISNFLNTFLQESLQDVSHNNYNCFLLYLENFLLWEELPENKIQ
jgi:hypothetical protein